MKEGQVGEYVGTMCWGRSTESRAHVSPFHLGGYHFGSWLCLVVLVFLFWVVFCCLFCLSGSPPFRCIGMHKFTIFPRLPPLSQ